MTAVITIDQLGSLRDLLAEQCERLGFCLLFPEHGEVSDTAFAFEARVCPLALTVVSHCFDHDPSVIAVPDKARLLSRRVRVGRMGWSGDIRLGLVSSLDNVPNWRLPTATPTPSSKRSASIPIAWVNCRLPSFASDSSITRPATVR